MAGRFEGTTVVDKPIDEVFAYLAAGTNDPAFSPRIQEIKNTTGEPVGVGTVFESKAKDAGMTTSRTIEITAFEAPTKIRWKETSKNTVTAVDGGYDLATEGSGTRVTIFNVLEGHGFGKVIAPLALRAAKKDAPAFAERIKAAVEAS
jgi:hypothetical protein